VPVHPIERKLAAIFAADIAGYSRLMARDEVGTLARLKACRAIIDGLIASHRGRIFNTAGDSIVADFASAVDAVQCAAAVQAAIATENEGGAADEPMQFRIGVHVGDVMVDGENLLGEVALRLSPRARIGWAVAAIGFANFFNRRFDEAVPKLLLAIQEDPSFPGAYRYLAACYAQMGRLDDAREIVKRLRAITSVVIPDAGFLRNAEHRELFLSGLRLAAGETK
jgi:tetratricopeptide (TPR) repeat protein